MNLPNAERFPGEGAILRATLRVLPPMLLFVLGIALGTGDGGRIDAADLVFPFLFVLDVVDVPLPKTLFEL